MPQKSDTCTLKTTPHLTGGAGLQQLFSVAGAVDLVMVILSKSVKEYDALSARLMAEVPQVIRMTTNVVIDAMKSDLYVPVDD